MLFSLRFRCFELICCVLLRACTLAQNLPQLILQSLSARVTGSLSTIATISIAFSVASLVHGLLLRAILVCLRRGESTSVGIEGEGQTAEGQPASSTPLEGRAKVFLVSEQPQPQPSAPVMQLTDMH